MKPCSDSTLLLGPVLALVACAAEPASPPAQAPTSPDSPPAETRPLPAAAPDVQLFRIVSESIDQPTVTELSPLLQECAASVESFFGGRFRSFTLTVLPDRAAFDASFPPEWGLSKTECWMVASGTAD